MRSISTTMSAVAAAVAVGGLVAWTAPSTASGSTTAPATAVATPTSGLTSSLMSPLTVAAKIRPRPVVDATTRASNWNGPALRRFDGTKFPRVVTRWATIVIAVMDELEIPRAYLPGILAQIEQESYGNPKAANLSDRNAAAGYPSRGLLQVIAPTYRTFAKPGFKNVRYQTTPYTNIWSALRYVKAEYGTDKFRRWSLGANQAY